MALHKPEILFRRRFFVNFFIDPVSSGRCRSPKWMDRFVPFELSTQARSTTLRALGAAASCPAALTNDMKPPKIGARLVTTGSLLRQYP